jgi:hypothetical protein
MSAPVHLAFNRERSRAAFRLFHPKGNIVTAEMIGALGQALDGIAEDPHPKLVTPKVRRRLQLRGEYP